MRHTKLLEFESTFIGEGGAVVLLSGGLDSSTLLHYVNQCLGVGSVHAISFAYGQRHSRELDMATRQAAAAGVATHHLLDIAFLSELVGQASALVTGGSEVPDLDAIPPEQRVQPPTYVPNRNMILLALAAAYAESRGCHDVFYGAQAQDEYGYWDCTPEFVARLNDTLSLNRRTPVCIRAPFVGLGKADVLQLALELGVDVSRTWSCYRGGETPCGTCPTCVERAAAFAAVGIDDVPGNDETTDEASPNIFG